MIFGEASVTVRATPDEALALLWDLERYRQADHKIGRVISSAPDGDDLVVRFVPKMRGLPGPPVTQRLHRTGPHRIDISDEPGSWVSRLQTFSGFLVAEPVDGATRVTHREQLDFHGPLAKLMERSLRGWLARDVVDEVARIGDILGTRR
ncbi:MAG TPA: SRPBCC family protein [Mycobacteriales bacterium]|nr:SRPBCC family protein [Mycobacteriales bacterium]